MVSNQNQSTNAVKKVAAALKESESPLNTTSENNAIAINDGKITLTTDSESSDNYGLGKYFEIKTGVTYENAEIIIKLSISRIHIKKEIYKPGYVDVEMTFDNFENVAKSGIDYAQKIQDYFLTVKKDSTGSSDANNGISSIMLDIKNKAGKDSSDSAKNAEVYLAKNYFICNVSMEQKEYEPIDNKNNYAIIVKLRAYSPDFFFTLRKYSKAYRSGKNTLSQIITDNIQAEYFVEQGKSVPGMLSHTEYTGNDGVLHESIQPYLVQYEESFHDFVVRVANRCGELFYYESGQLFLGINPDNVTKDNTLKIHDAETGIPAKLSFSNLPNNYDKEVNMLSASLLDDGTNAAKSEDLYSSSNVVAYDQLRRVNKDKDEISFTEVLGDCHQELGATALKSKGLEGIIQDTTKKLADMMSTTLGATTFSDESRSDNGTLRLTQKEVDDNNEPISDVPEHELNDEKTIKAFKDNYKAAHKDVFFEENVSYDMTDEEIEKHWKDSSTAAYKALATYKQKITDAKAGNDIKNFKANYKTNHPDEFVVITNYKISDVFNNDKDHGGNEEAKAKLKNKQTELDQQKNSDLKKFKQKYEYEHIDEFKTSGTRKSEEDINNIWMDITTEPGKARLIYIGTHPNKEGEKADVWSQISGKYKSEEWKNPTIEMCKLVRDSQCCPNTEDFKKEYEGQNPTYFWDDYTPISDKETVWKDASSAAHKALEKEEANQNKKIEDAINDFENQYIIDNPGLLVNRRDMKEDEIESLWADGKSNAYHALEFSYKHGQGKEYQYIRDRLAYGAKEDTLEDEFKTQYQKDNSKEFKKNETKTPIKKDGDEQKGQDEIFSGNEIGSCSKENAEAAKNALDAFIKNPDNDIQKLSNRFYNWINNIEFNLSRRIQETKIFSKIPSCLLGEFYYFGNGIGKDVYYVYGVDTDIYSDVYISDGAYKTRYNAKSMVKYVPTETHTERNEKYTYQNSVFPPLAEIPHIRKASPQQGVVASVSDPLRCGRVQINYPWCSGVNSPWIPVSTPMAGNGGTDYTNFLMTPEKGEWVIVNYEGGNVERPYVSGSLIHNDLFWGRIPREKKSFRDGHHTITHNGAGITWVDGKGTGPVDILIPSIAKLMDLSYKKSDELEDKRHKKDWAHSTGGSLILSDYNGFYKIEMDASKRNVTIESPYGNVDINAFTGINISAPNGDIKISGKNVTIDAGNELKLTSGSNIKKKEFKDSYAGLLGKYTGMIAGNMLKTGLNKLSTVGTIGKISDGILALGKLTDVDLWRHMYEIIFRPVGGTLSLNSKRNLIIEAGKGKALVPVSTLSTISTPTVGKSAKATVLSGFKALFGKGPSEKDNAEDKERNDVNDLIGSKTVTSFVNIMTAANTSIQNFATICSGIRTLKAEYEHYVPGPNGDEVGKIKHLDYKTYENAIKKAFEEADSQNTALQNIEIKELLKLQNDEQASPEEINTQRNICDSYKKMVNTCIQFKKFSGDVDTDGSFLKALHDSVMDNNEIHPEDFGMADGKFTDFLNGILKESVTSVLFGNNKLNTSGALTAMLAVEENALRDKIAKLKKNVTKSILWNFTNYSSTLIQNMSIVEAAGFGKDSKKITLENLVDQNQGEAFYAKFLKRLDIVAVKKDNKASNVTKFEKTALSTILSEAGTKDLYEYDEDKNDWKFAAKWQKLLNYNGVSGPRSIWDAASEESDGCILVSGGKGMTLKVGAGDQNWKNAGHQAVNVERLKQILSLP